MSQTPKYAPDGAPLNAAARRRQRRTKQSLPHAAATIQPFSFTFEEKRPPSLLRQLGQLLLRTAEQLEQTVVIDPPRPTAKNTPDDHAPRPRPAPQQSAAVRMNQQGDPYLPPLHVRQSEWLDNDQSDSELERQLEQQLEDERHAQHVFEQDRDLDLEREREELESRENDDQKNEN